VSRTTPSRLSVRKTYKLYIGGAFPRSESGRVWNVQSPKTRKELGHASRASRKDLRDAVLAAKKAGESWATKTPSNRGQILYRMSEILEHRSAEMISELIDSADLSPSSARREVQLSIDRLVWYAGWTDKFTHLFGNVNPVSTPHFNFSIPEPMGVVALITPDEPSLLGLISMIAPALVGGNTVVVLASETIPLPSITFAEILATSDLPSGVVNILTGFRKEIVPQMARHMDIQGLVIADEEAEWRGTAQNEAACNLKRVTIRDLGTRDWLGSRAEDPYWIADTLEVKTTWHPIGM
jgi:acyl-CoA reductase-like NAD-dependent aldehyde dehydrogenase